jgi:hypothetical protein
MLIHVQHFKVELDLRQRRIHAKLITTATMAKNSLAASVNLASNSTPKQNVAFAVDKENVSMVQRASADRQFHLRLL